MREKDSGLALSDSGYFAGSLDVTILPASLNFGSPKADVRAEVVRSSRFLKSTSIQRRARSLARNLVPAARNASVLANAPLAEQLDFLKFKTAW